MLKDRFIICLSGTNWELPWGICQRVMSRLSQYNKILFVEYQPSLLHCYMRNFSHTKYDRDKRGMFMKINENLTIYKPEAALPFNNYFRIINALNQSIIRHAIIPEVKMYKKKDVIIWAFVPGAIDCIKRMDRTFTIYHCGGNYPEEKKNFLRKKNITNMENDMVRSSELVIAQTRSLCDKFMPLGKKTFYMPSAIDFDQFLSAIRAPLPEGEDELVGMRHPRVGIVGYFDDNFYDIELLNYLIDSKKEWSFVFIGPVTGKAKGFNALKTKPNTFFLGYKEPMDIPRYINTIDVGIIPYKVNDYTRTVSPNKFYEYLACGKPVVSTRLPDIEGYRDVLKVSNNKYEFLEGLNLFLLTGMPENLKSKAVMIAKENSLGRYMEEVSALIEKMIGT